MTKRDETGRKLDMFAVRSKSDGTLMGTDTGPCLFDSEEDAWAEFNSGLTARFSDVYEIVAVTLTIGGVVKPPYDDQQA